MSQLEYLISKSLKPGDKIELTGILFRDSSSVTIKFVLRSPCFSPDNNNVACEISIPISDSPVDVSTTVNGDKTSFEYDGKDSSGGLITNGDENFTIRFQVIEEMILYVGINGNDVGSFYLMHSMADAFFLQLSGAEKLTELHYCFA